MIATTIWSSNPGLKVWFAVSNANKKTYLREHLVHEFQSINVVTFVLLLHKGKSQKSLRQSFHFDQTILETTAELAVGQQILGKNK